jgi:hypothetical protein
MNIHLSPPSHDNLGRHGVVARITTDHGGWHGVYCFHTHGMTAEEVAAERDRIEAWHSRKAAKLTELAALIGFDLGHGHFTIIDATVRHRGHGCEVVCRAKSGATTIEHREFFDDPAHAPSAEDVISIMGGLIATRLDASDDAIEHLSSVRAALGLE